MSNGFPQDSPGRDRVIALAHRHAIPLGIGSWIALGAIAVFLVEHFLGDRWIGWRLQVILMSIGAFGMLIARAMLWLVAWDEKRNPDSVPILTPVETRAGGGARIDSSARRPRTAPLAAGCPR